MTALLSRALVRSKGARHDLAMQVRIAEAASAPYGWPPWVIEDAGDDPPMEQPQAFLRALREALETSTGQEAAT